jgi:hypothetical protein
VPIRCGMTSATVDGQFQSNVYLSEQFRNKTSLELGCSQSCFMECWTDHTDHPHSVKACCIAFLGSCFFLGSCAGSDYLNSIDILKL